MDRVDVAIIGATGYGGAELLRTLLVHPRVRVRRAVAIDHVGEPIGSVHPPLEGWTDLVVEQMPVREAVADVDVAFFALPHRTTAAQIAQLDGLDVRIVDLSGDFRLRDPARYAAYYGVEHPRPDLLGQFVYALPELSREAIATARRLASPGCFATAIALGLLPVARAGWLDGPVRTVAITGSSGSGVRPSPTTHHPVRANNLRAYRALHHQHTPEIEQTLHAAGASSGLRLEFVPVSGPLARGILATSFVEVDGHVTEADVEQAFDRSYADEPFVRIPRGRLPEVCAVKGSMVAEVGFRLSPPCPSRGRRTLVCFSAIDNLVKGGAGQAVQAFNCMMGWPETTALDRPAPWP